MFVQVGFHGKKWMRWKNCSLNQESAAKAVIWLGKLFVGVTLWFQPLAAFCKTPEPTMCKFFPRATSLGCSWDMGSSSRRLCFLGRDPAFGKLSACADRDAGDVVAVWPVAEGGGGVMSHQLVETSDCWCALTLTYFVFVTLTRGPFCSETTWLRCDLWQNLLMCLAKD